MRFYGDRERPVCPRAGAEGLAERLREAAAVPAGASRHAALAAILVGAAELAQGLADAERAAAGVDAFGPLEALASGVTAAVAGSLWRSWQTGGEGRPPGTAVLVPLLAAPLPDAVTIRRAEGFALYGLYPEVYAAAAHGLPGATFALGLRSIGTALAPMVAAGAGSTALPVSVRPVGDPFRRRVDLAATLAARLAAAPGPIAVVDEGPGLSGSSLVGAVEALEAHGIPAERVLVFPGHLGPPGPAAAVEVRRTWGRLRLRNVPFEALFLSDAPLALPRLVEDVVGPLDGPPVELSAGAWRPVVFGPRGPWPPTEGWRERRKYLVQAGGRPWLVRFAGLGEAGERTLTRARTLAAAGLVPAPAGLRHGFLVEAFEGSAVPLPRSVTPRARLLGAVRRHLTFVAARCPAAVRDGASPRSLVEVAVENTRELLGGDAAADLDRLAARLLPEVTRLARPVAVDGRLQRWEWLVRPDGRILKADALDHHADHALVGCQDALWDVAGATLELGLSAAEAARLGTAVRDASRGAPLRCLPLYLGAYAAFEAGRWAAAAAEPGVDPEEQARRRGEAVRLADALRRHLGGRALERPGARDTVAGSR